MKPHGPTHYIIMLILSCVVFVSGCGYIQASADVDFAIEAAARENLANFRTVTQARANLHDSALAELENKLDERIVIAADGLAALSLLRDYRVRRSQLTKDKSDDLANHAKAVSNAAYILELIGQRIALRARLKGLIDRFPAIAHIKAMAEVESKSFINAISSPP